VFENKLRQWMGCLGRCFDRGASKVWQQDAEIRVNEGAAARWRRWE
jgi:hypothetical protein